MSNMIDFIVGAGQGGCRIAKTFAEEFDAPAAYMNLARVDFSQLDVPEDVRLLIDAGGTGRSPELGAEIAKKSRRKINAFLDAQQIPEECRVVVCIGGGGGSGAGLMSTVLDYVVRKKCDVLLIYTLPEKREGLPAKPNALNSLNKLIENYVSKEKIATMVVDNDFCTSQYDMLAALDPGDYWADVNMGIVRGLLRFYYLTNLDKFTNFVDVNAGYGALDERELYRVMYCKGGFLDFREFTCDEPEVELAKRAKFKSKIFGNLDIGTAKQYIVSIGFPYSMKTDKRVPEFVDAIFKKLERVTKTTFVLRSTFFNKKLDVIRVNVLLSGLIKSHGLEKIIAQTVKDVEKYKQKSSEKSLDLTGLNF